MLKGPIYAILIKVFDFAKFLFLPAALVSLSCWVISTFLWKKVIFHKMEYFCKIQFWLRFSAILCFIPLNWVNICNSFFKFCRKVEVFAWFLCYFCEAWFFFQSVQKKASLTLWAQCCQWFSDAVMHFGSELSSTFSFSDETVCGQTGERTSSPLYMCQSRTQTLILSVNIANEIPAHKKTLRPPLLARKKTQKGH